MVPYKKLKIEKNFCMAFDWNSLEWIGKTISSGDFNSDYNSADLFVIRIH